MHIKMLIQSDRSEILLNLHLIKLSLTAPLEKLIFSTKIIDQALSN